VLESSNEPGLLACRLHADGSQAKILCTAGRVDSGQIVGDPFLRMDGQAVFKLAVNVLDSSAREVLADAKLDVTAIDWLIPHQANVRILSATARKLDLPESRVIVTVDVHGNTSAASVPLALDVAVRDGRVARGQHLVLQGVGGGFTWGFGASAFLTTIAKMKIAFVFPGQGSQSVGMLGSFRWLAGGNGSDTVCR
jgi:3-oxoacyl-[acyl-carrier-protein] synthase III